MARTSDDSHEQQADDYDGDSRPSKGGKGSTKSKDLSHVPCRFFKAGACTAGASCPFSHASAEPGQPKGVCQWYIKGNCKFGHKCALAHVLPGQPISMDRKNKRAEQQASKQAAQGQNPTANSSSQPSKDKDRERNDSTASTTTPSGLSSTAPRPASTSISSRPPMMIGKAAPTLSAVASDTAMHDPNFRGSTTEDTSSAASKRSSGIATSFAAAVAAGLGSSTQSGLSALRPSSTASQSLASSVNAGSSAAMPDGRSPTKTANDVDPSTNKSEPYSSSITPTSNLPLERGRSPIPQSPPVQKQELVRSSDLGFGPIGSPPGVSRLHGSLAKSPPSGTGIPLARGRLPNGMSPSASPRATSILEQGFPSSISSSVHQSASNFMPYGPGGSVPNHRASQDLHHQVNSGLDNHRVLANGANGGGYARQSAWAGSLPASTFLNDSMTSSSAVLDEEDDIEDFLPSSLNELLTPGEQQRRMSRSNAQRPRFDPDGAGGQLNNSNPVLSPQPRFVSSVPTASILNNFRGMWDDTNPAKQDIGSGGLRGGESWRSSGLGGGISGSFGGGGLGVEVPSPSLLGTSNASAAFLPGHMHRNGGGLTAGARDVGGISSSFDPRQSSNISRFDPNSGLAMSPPRFNPGTSALSSQQPSNLSGGNVTNNGSMSAGVYDTSYYGLHDASSNPRNPHVPQSQLHPGNQYTSMSPTSARALRSHEPGQSLPQGLAAGLSRLHLMPGNTANPISPPASTGSPSANLTLSGSITSNGGGFASQQNAYGSWLKNTSGEASMSPPPPGLNSGLGMGGTAGSYSSSRFGLGGGGQGNYPSALSRGVPNGVGSVPRRDGSSAWTAGVQASPLSRPTIPDDDAVFDMDA